MTDTFARRVPSDVAKEAAGINHGGVRRMVDSIAAVAQTLIDTKRDGANNHGGVTVFSAASDSKRLFVAEGVRVISEPSPILQSVWREARGVHPAGWYFLSGFPDYWRHDPKPGE